MVSATPVSSLTLSARAELKGIWGWTLLVLCESCLRNHWPGDVLREQLLLLQHSAQRDAEGSGSPGRPTLPCLQFCLWEHVLPQQLIKFIWFGKLCLLIHKGQTVQKCWVVFSVSKSCGFSSASSPSSGVRAGASPWTLSRRRTSQPHVDTARLIQSISANYQPRPTPPPQMCCVVIWKPHAFFDQCTLPRV